MPPICASMRYKYGVHKSCSHLLCTHLSGSEKNTIFNRLQDKSNSCAEYSKVDALECIAENFFFTHYQQRRYRTAKKTFCSFRDFLGSDSFSLLNVDFIMLDKEISFIYFWSELECNSNRSTVLAYILVLIALAAVTLWSSILKLLFFAFVGDVLCSFLDVLLEQIPSSFFIFSVSLDSVSE